MAQEIWLKVPLPLWPLKPLRSRNKLLAYGALRILQTSSSRVLRVWCADLPRLLGPREGDTPSWDLRSALDHDLLEATLRVEIASIEFKFLIEDIPSGLPHPDGSQRIQNSSRKLAAALRQRERAHKRLDDYLSQEKVQAQ